MLQASGRPRLRNGETAQQVRVTVTQEDAEYLQATGGGNRSQGVRECILWHRGTATHRGSFLARCAAEGRDPAEILTALMEGYANMPTRAEILEALGRGPQDDRSCTDET